MHLIERIRSEFSGECIVDKMERSEHLKCTVNLCGTPKPYLLIDLDLPGSPLGQSDRRCDYLVFVDDVEGIFCVAPVEFKSSSWKGKIVGQLQAGAKAAEKYIPEELKCRFRPVAVLGCFSKGQKKNIRQFVSFWGQSRPVRIIDCGDRLIDILQD